MTYTKDVYQSLREKIVSKLEKRLTQKRFEHTLRVESTAVELTQRYGGDSYDASIAALMHDYAKNDSVKKKEKYIEKYGIQLSAVERDRIDLTHGKIAAAIAEHKYNIDNASIIDAITYHTTGRPGMSKLEKIIYIADFIEPGRRSFQGLDKVRELAYEDLDRCLIKILMLTINHLMDKDMPIDPITEQTYEYYFERYNDEHIAP